MSPCCAAGFEASLDRLFASRYCYREDEAMKLKLCARGAGGMYV